jgi:hypothetical protein
MTVQNKSSFVSKKPYCKVCHDAGKEEAVYTSHYLRSEPGPKGKVVCPTLLALSCKQCLKSGHTYSYCPEIKANSKLEAKNNYLNKENFIKPIKCNDKKKNSFEYLLEEKETVSTNKNNKKSSSSIIKEEEFPALTSTSKLNTKTAVVNENSYAGIAKKGHELTVKEEIIAEIYKAKTNPTVVVKPTIIVQKKKTICWSDYTDEDDYEEEELMTAEEYFSEYKCYENQYGVFIPYK